VTVNASVEQTFPSPTIPRGHAHSNEPSEFVQYASSSHEEATPHSSTSTHVPSGGGSCSKPTEQGRAIAVQAYSRQIVTPSDTFPDKVMVYLVEQGKLERSRCRGALYCSGTLDRAQQRSVGRVEAFAPGPRAELPGGAVRDNTPSPLMVVSRGVMGGGSMEPETFLDFNLTSVTLQHARLLEVTVAEVNSVRPL
jgi:hypothetical protein